MDYFFWFLLVPLALYAHFYGKRVEKPTEPQNPNQSLTGYRRNHEEDEDDLEEDEDDLEEDEGPHGPMH